MECYKFSRRRLDYLVRSQPWLMTPWLAVLYSDDGRWTCRHDYKFLLPAHPSGCSMDPIEVQTRPSFDGVAGFFTSSMTSGIHAVYENGEWHDDLEQCHALKSSQTMISRPEHAL